MRTSFKKLFGISKRLKEKPSSGATDNSDYSVNISTSSPAPSEKQSEKEQRSESAIKPVASSDLISQPLKERKEQDTKRPKAMSHDLGLESSKEPGDPPPTFATPEDASAAGCSDEGEAPHLLESYDQIPVLEQMKLPRGGLSVETKAVGRVQFGIPPETIKDSMKLGIPVPEVYIVPVERFCREMGPALGVNLAEFEFPAYFNFFVYKKRCTLVVDSVDAEENIRRVFSETLLGPAQFRREGSPIAYEPEDFAPDFPKDAIPNFQKELQHFRIMPDGKELVIETLLEFSHFQMRADGHDNLGVPPSEGKDKASSDTSDTAAGQTVEEMFCGGDDEDEEDLAAELVPADEQEVESRETKRPWTYSQARYMGDVATIWPKTATDEQKNNRSVPRVEIFKMPGGTEYIVHDVDENNFIVGKARLSGHVRVSESMSVDGFGGNSIMDDTNNSSANACDAMEQELEAVHGTGKIAPHFAPPTFHPPSFGVTVLGNSHGFDKSGSVSGYVLWINGRGVMIDPPPYSSATLEREGIRPRTIVGIILTHCHADHDAGAFQKVLTGSPVVVITTPTIYKSFIRKYAALSALSPALLRHSHRFKPAVIGLPLRFQGATFHFTYTLHTIPCVGFRVEWRGRSMVFTGDHFNSPTGMEQLEAKGVLSKARHADLRNLPLQDTDLLLHEAGAPPIHTPLEVLLQLPSVVKKRLYVVHTSALPENCELKAAPTGTKGTIRLDQVDSSAGYNNSMRSMVSGNERQSASSRSVAEDEYDVNWNGGNEYGPVVELGESARRMSVPNRTNIHSSFAHLELSSTAGGRKGRSSVFSQRGAGTPPLVALRPASSTDAWFILNLLSAVPFLSSLSYTSTMELLETARVDAFKKNDTVLPAVRRSQLLCVVWEGTCSESPAKLIAGSPAGANPLNTINENPDAKSNATVWHAGDWTGPISLQPDRLLSGESATSETHDVVAVSSEGVKAITVEYNSLHSILKTGSSLYRKYLERKASQARAKMDVSSSDQHSNATEKLLDDALKDLNVLDLLNCNSALRKLDAVQKRHLESLAEGPICFQPGERLWRAGCPVDKAFVVVSGSASFVPRRRNAGSATVYNGDESKLSDSNPGTEMQIDAKKAMKELGRMTPTRNGSEVDAASLSSMEPDDHRGAAMPLEKVFKSGPSGSQNPDFEKLRQGLERRALHANTEGSVASADFSSAESTQGDHDSYDTDNDSQLDYTFIDDADPGTRSRRTSVLRRRSSRARKANKVLGRLYNRRAFTGGLVFSRGHFLGDVSKMVAGLLASSLDTDDEGPTYGFGDQVEGTGDKITELIIPEEGAQQVTHNSTLTAGKKGCVVLVFPKSSIIPFLDQYPGLLLSLLGTQVVV